MTDTDADVDVDTEAAKPYKEYAEQQAKAAQESREALIAKAAESPHGYEADGINVQSEYQAVEDKRGNDPNKVQDPATIKDEGPPTPAGPADAVQQGLASSNVTPEEKAAASGAQPAVTAAPSTVNPAPEGVQEEPVEAKDEPTPDEQPTKAAEVVQAVQTAESHEEVNKLVSDDQRKTVQDAAEKRKSELNG